MCVCVVCAVSPPSDLQRLRAQYTPALEIVFRCYEDTHATGPSCHSTVLPHHVLSNVNVTGIPSQDGDGARASSSSSLVSLADQVHRSRHGHKTAPVTPGPKKKKKTGVGVVVVVGGGGSGGRGQLNRTSSALAIRRSDATAGDTGTSTALAVATAAPPTTKQWSPFFGRRPGQARRFLDHTVLTFAVGGC